MFHSSPSSHFGHGVWMRGLRFAELQKEVLAQFTEIKLPDLPKRKLIDSSSDTEACRVSCGTGMTDSALYLALAATSRAT